MRGYTIWIKKYETFIENFKELNDIISRIENILKTKGLCWKTIEECKRLMNRSSNLYVEKLKEKLESYFSKIENEFKGETILCTSDIIESAFGKYKNYVSQNPMSGVTGLILCLAAFTSKLTTEDIYQALTKTKVKDVQDGCGFNQ